MAHLETLERIVRRGVYKGPLMITWVALGGGFDGPSPYNMMEFHQARARRRGGSRSRR